MIPIREFPAPTKKAHPDHVARPALESSTIAAPVNPMLRSPAEAELTDDQIGEARDDCHDHRHLQLIENSEILQHFHIILAAIVFGTRLHHPPSLLVVLCRGITSLVFDSLSLGM